MAEKQSTASIQTKGFRVSKNTVFQLVALILLVAIIGPQFKEFKTSLKALEHADGVTVLLALLIYLTAYVWASYTYLLLAWHKLKLRRLYLMQWAAVFINRLVPGGLGALGVNALYLRHEKHTDGQALAVATTNNVLGLVANTLVFWISLAISPGVLNKLSFNFGLKQLGIGSLILAFVILVSWIISLVFPKLAKTIKSTALDTLNSLRQFRHRPKSLALGLLTQIAVSISYSLCLFFCAHAVGLSVSLVEAIIVMSIGTSFASITPTPGGVGGAEAGLTLAFSWFGYPVQTALAAALLYRLIIFWLPIIPGYFCYSYALKKDYLKGST